MEDDLAARRQHVENEIALAHRTAAGEDEDVGARGGVDRRRERLERVGRQRQ